MSKITDDFAVDFQLSKYLRTKNTSIEALAREGLISLEKLVTIETSGKINVDDIDLLAKALKVKSPLLTLEIIQLNHPNMKNTPAGALVEQLLKSA